MGCSVSVCAGRDTGRKAAIERERCLCFLHDNQQLSDLRSSFILFEKC